MKKPKAKPNPCYGCIYYNTFEDEGFSRCGVTGFNIDDGTLNTCKKAGWKRTRWNHTSTNTQHKHHHYPHSQ